MYCIIKNNGDYDEIPYAKTRAEAENYMTAKYSSEEIQKYEMEVTNDKDE